LKSARNSKSLFLSNFAVLPVQLEPATWKFWLVWRDVLKTSGSRILNYAHSSEINGKKAKIGIDRYYQPKPINAYVCFLDTNASAMQLRALVFCKDERALETAQTIFKSIRFKDT